VDLLGLVLALGFVAAPAWFWRGGVLEAEAIEFFGRYWSDRPVIEKILDSRGYDDHQGRELSYAVDFLDAQWEGRQLAQGSARFLAPSALVASLLTLVVWAWGAPRAFPRLGRMNSWPFSCSFSRISSS
jgi:hypothetical protein